MTSPKDPEDIPTFDEWKKKVMEVEKEKSKIELLFLFILFFYKGTVKYAFLFLISQIKENFENFLKVILTKILLITHM